MNTAQMTQLHAIGTNQPMSYNKNKNYSSTYKVYKFNGNRAIISRICDSLEPMYIT